MHYFALFLVLFLSVLPLWADDFERLNPTLTKEMIKRQADAKTCDEPAVAKEKFGDDFRYGCFCGKGYPQIKHPSKKYYTKLNRTEREALISKYYAIKPYDSIDEVCMKHDICYIYRGGADEMCNDAIFNSMRELEDAFFNVRYQKKEHKKEDRCRALAADIGSVFKTIFAEGNNHSFFNFTMKMMSTSIIVGSKEFQKFLHGMNGNPTYPLEGEKCWVLDINVSSSSD